MADYEFPPSYRCRYTNLDAVGRYKTDVDAGELRWRVKSLGDG